MLRAPRSVRQSIITPGLSRLRRHAALEAASEQMALGRRNSGYGQHECKRWQGAQRVHNKVQTDNVHQNLGQAASFDLLAGCLLDWYCSGMFGGLSRS